MAQSLFVHTKYSFLKLKLIYQFTVGILIPANFSDMVREIGSYRLPTHRRVNQPKGKLFRDPSIFSIEILADRNYAYIDALICKR